MVCNVRLLGHLEGRATRRLVRCGGEELRPHHWVQWELHDSAGIVWVQWELRVCVRCVPDPDPLSMGKVSRLFLYRLPTGGSG